MTTKRKVVNKKCIHVKNIKNNEDLFSDLTVIKERIKYDDGTEEPRVRYIENIQRPFWVEKKRNQTYKDKKETRPRSEMDEYWCTQSELPFRVKKVLGVREPGRSLRKLARSPYVYGLDNDVTVMVKRQLDKRYNGKYGDWTPELSMAVLDYETDMESGEDFIVEMGSVTMKDKWVCVVDRNFFEKKGITDYEERMGEYIDRYLGADATKRGVKDFAVEFVDSEIEVVKRLFAKLHEWKPDVVSVWNLDFEIKRTMDACRRAGIPYGDVFVDPQVSEAYSDVSWIPDEGNKEKADGSSSTKDASDKWHKLTAACSWQFIDNMSLYRMLRAVEQKLGSYSLDGVLNHVFEGKVKKMKFDKLHGVIPNTPEWHKVMQKKFPFEYVCYNIFDCVVMEILDEKEGDVSKKLMTYVGISNWMKAKSNPTRLADAYHFFLQENFDRVLCSTSDRMKHVFDKFTLPKADWVVTLDNTLPITRGNGYNPYLKDKNGEDLYDLPTKIFLHTYDIDVEGAYPTNELTLNVGRDTTLVEVCEVDGQTRHQHMSVCVNLTNADGNGSRICREVLGYASNDELYEEFMKEVS